MNAIGTLSIGQKAGFLATYDGFIYIIAAEGNVVEGWVAPSHFHSVEIGENGFNKDSIHPAFLEHAVYHEKYSRFTAMKANLENLLYDFSVLFGITKEGWKPMAYNPIVDPDGKINE